MLAAPNCRGLGPALSTRRSGTIPPTRLPHLRGDLRSLDPSRAADLMPSKGARARLASAVFLALFLALVILLIVLAPAAAGQGKHGPEARYADNGAERR